MLTNILRGPRAPAACVSSLASVGLSLRCLERLSLVELEEDEDELLLLLLRLLLSLLPVLFLLRFLLPLLLELLLSEPVLEFSASLA